MIECKNLLKTIQEKAQKQGANSLTEKEATILMLSYVIHKKINLEHLASTLLNKFGSYQEILDAHYLDLINEGGLSMSSAKEITFLKDISDYIRMSKANKTKSLKNTQELVDFFKSFMTGKSHEEFFVVGLSKNNEIKGIKKIAKGKVNQVEIEKKDISDFCILNDVKKVAICHNHPKASCEPSRNDDICTTNIFKWLNSFGIELVDHITVGIDGCFSFSEVEYYK